MTYKAFLTSACGILLLNACTMNAAQRAEMTLEPAYKAEKAQEENEIHQKVTQGWWTLYGDDELNTLLNYAFTNSPDINQIRARLTQAKALRVQSRADRLPSADLNGQYETQRGDNTSPSSYAMTGAASFELDLWGKNRANDKEAQLEIEASRQDLYSAALSLSANIVSLWLEIHSLMEEETLLRDQIEINQQILELQKKRFELGQATALDILQQQETLQQSIASLPDILSDQVQAANNMALLLGDTPRDNTFITASKMPKLLPMPADGVDASLLENRPDLVAAWKRVRASEWAVHAAWANRLPSFNLSANTALSAANLGNLFDNWLLDLVAGVSSPLYDGGSRKAEELRQEALADEAYLTYRQSVLEAVNDVENALAQNTYQDQKIAALDIQLEASQNTLAQAQLSYINGQSDYINVLSALNSKQALEQQIVQAHLTQAQNRVNLYRALGGTNWTKTLDETMPEKAIAFIYETKKDIE